MYGFTFHSDILGFTIFSWKILVWLSIDKYTQVYTNIHKPFPSAETKGNGLKILRLTFTGTALYGYKD